MNYIISYCLLSALTISVFKSSSSDVPGKCDSTMQENISLGEVFGKSLAVDSQSVLFSLSDENAYFSVESGTGRIRVKSLIDREEICQRYKSTCPCKPRPHQPLCSLTLRILQTPKSGAYPPTVIVQNICIIDLNDNSPIIDTTQKVTIKENAPIGSVIPLRPADDKDSPEFSVHQYILTCKDTPSLFQLNYTLAAFSPDNREVVKLTLIRPLDHETQKRHFCDLKAQDGPENLRSTTTSVIEIQVEDVNDNSPRWITNDFTISLPENFPLYQTFFQLRAKDDDEFFGQLRYVMDPMEYFGMDERTGELSLRRLLDYDKPDSRQILLPVKALDNGSPEPLYVTATVTIDVTDVNDNPPHIVINKPRIFVTENKPAGYVDYFRVMDEDVGDNGNVTCHLMNPRSPFIIQKQDVAVLMYAINTTQPLDRETKSTWKLDIICSDFGIPSLNDRATVTIDVIDENDNPPRFNNASLVIHVREGNTLAQVIGQLQANDADSTHHNEFTLIPPDNNVINVRSRTGDVVALRNFDCEAETNYNFTVMVRDSTKVSHNQTGQLFIYCVDENDNAPQFERSYIFQIYENMTVNTVIGEVKATDADQGLNGQVTYSRKPSPGKLSFSPFLVTNDGKIILQSALDREKEAHYNLEIIAMDRNSPPAHTTSTTVIINVLDVNDCPPRFKRGHPQPPSHQVTCSQTYLMPPFLVDDCDTQENSQTNYRLLASFPKSETPKFSVNVKNGEIIVSDAEQFCKLGGGLRRLVLMVFDPTKPNFNDTITLTLQFPNEDSGSVSSPSKNQLTDSKGGSTKEGDQLWFDWKMIATVFLICLTMFLFVLVTIIILQLRKRTIHREKQLHKGGASNLQRSRRTNSTRGVDTEEGKFPLHISSPILISQENYNDKLYQPLHPMVNYTTQTRRPMTAMSATGLSQSSNDSLKCFTLVNNDRLCATNNLHLRSNMPLLDEQEMEEMKCMNLKGGEDNAQMGCKNENVMMRMGLTPEKTCHYQTLPTLQSNPGLYIMAENIASTDPEQTLKYTPLSVAYNPRDSPLSRDSPLMHQQTNHQSHHNSAKAVNGPYFSVSFV